MHLAVLVTNTDESAFAQAHPKDGEKFPAMMRRVRPDWDFSAFSVKDGEFPDRIDRFDGLMLTGSPASVNGGAAWIARLLTLIRDAHRRRIPMFGACFGHQAIALALGGRVTRNPGGWVHGSVPVALDARRDWMAGLPDEMHLYASHAEQVSTLPEGADILAHSPGCAVAGFAIGDHIYTTQHHPEMTPEFIAALTEELSGDLGPDLTARARASLHAPANMKAYAESVARFFEQAARRSLAGLPRD